MKVLMTADAVGGVWTYAVELCTALRDQDIHFVLAVLGPPPNEAQRKAVAALENVRLVCRPGKLEWMDEPWGDVAHAGEWLLDLARAEQADLVHLNGYANATLDWERPVLVAAHSCVCTWWRAVRDERAPAAWDRYRTTVATALQSAHRVVTPTAAFLRALRQEYGTVSRASVISNGLELSCEINAAKGSAIFACGRLWDEAKNLRLLDAAVSDLPWKTYVAGDDTSPDGRSYHATNLSSLGRLGTTDIREWFARASIFAHPALYEPFGLAVLEAARHGCALVLADIPTLRELWQGAALFVSPRNAQLFRTALGRLIESPGVRLRLAQAARRRSRQLTSSAMANAYRAQYEALIEQHSKPRAVA